MNPEREIRYIKQKCNGCGKCLRCPKDAVRITEEDGLIIDRNNCIACGRCVENCPKKAKTWFGYEIGIEDLMNKIRRDKVFFDSSGGGATLGGGAPLLQGEFAEEILRRCRKEGINTAIETEAYCDFEVYKGSAVLCDTVFTDLKAIDPVKHKELTGAGNRIILENIRRLGEWLYGSGERKAFIIRIPLLPGVNYDLEDFHVVSGFLKGLKGVSGIEILPFHSLGEHKYKQLGVDCKYQGRTNLKAGDVQDYTEILRKQGLSVTVTDW